MSEWQPIETAPTDIPILVYCDHPCAESGWDMSKRVPVWIVVRSGEFGETDFYVEHDSDGNYLSYWDAKPTHWMPLPSQPAS